MLLEHSANFNNMQNAQTTFNKTGACFKYALAQTLSEFYSVEKSVYITWVDPKEERIQSPSPTQVEEFAHWCLKCVFVRCIVLK